MENKKEKVPFSKEFMENFEIFVVLVSIVMFIYTFGIARLCRVDGPSMNQTLYDGEFLIISNMFYEPSENDVIVFHQTNDLRNRFNEPIVKRVIATAGKYVKIDFDNAKVYVSEDNVFDETDVIDETSYIYLDSGRWRMSGVMETYVPEGKLFVMGDNRNNSSDSRYNDIGLVDTRRVLGKVLVRVLPLSKCGSVYN